MGPEKLGKKENGKMRVRGIPPGTMKVFDANSLLVHAVTVTLKLDVPLTSRDNASLPSVV